MSKSKIVPDYKKMFYLMTFMFIFFTVTVVGGLCNTIVKESNGGRMPVYMEYEMSSDRHFSYFDKTSVNHWYFTDIIELGDYMASFGDILMFLGGGLTLGVVITSFYMIFTNKLQQVEKKHERS